MGSINLNGHAFKIPTFYEEGHRCSASDAQTLQINRQNKMKSGLKKIIEEGLDQELSMDAIEDAVSNFVAQWQPGKRGGGGPKKVKDPIQVEAMAIAKLHARNEARKAGFKGAELAKQVSRRAKELAARPDYLKLAKQTLALQE